MKAVYMNREILDVCCAVRSYVKFLVAHNRVSAKIPIEEFDFFEMAEKYFYSLELPEGVRKNRVTFDRIFTLNKKELESWCSCEECELSKFIFMKYSY